MSASFQDIRRLFVLAYFIAASVGNNPADDTVDLNNNRRYFLPRGEIEG